MKAKFLRNTARFILGAFLVFAGVSHLGPARAEFQAQVPSWLPLDADFVVLASGVVEIILGIWLASGYQAPIAGLVGAAFFIAIFPGNISQWLTGTAAFGLNTDEARLIRLFFQPVLVIWVLWATGGWAWLRDRLKSN